MVVFSAAVLLVLVAGVFSSCPDPSAVQNFDKSQLAGKWFGLYWKTEYQNQYKGGYQTFEVAGDRVNFRVTEVDIATSQEIVNTGHIHQIGNSGKFTGERDNVANNVSWYVTGFSAGKWLTYWQCRLDTSNELAFALGRYGVRLTSEEIAAAAAAIPGYSEHPENYARIDYHDRS